MPKLHLDTDLGGDIDDLCALAMVLNWPDVDICDQGQLAVSNSGRARPTDPRCGSRRWRSVQQHWLNTVVDV